MSYKMNFNEILYKFNEFHHDSNIIKIKIINKINFTLI